MNFTKYLTLEINPDRNTLTKVGCVFNLQLDLSYKIMIHKCKVFTFIENDIYILLY